MDAPETSPPEKPKRRVRYSGKHPRRFEEKYKELNPDKYGDTVAKVVASGKTPAGTHRPIMVDEVLQVLDPKPGEIGVDCTLGYGGHSAELLKRIAPGGRLAGLDVDPLELPKTEARLRQLGYGEDAFTARHSNFAGIRKVLSEIGIDAADFILADLGVSSMQLDNPARGFSFKVDAPLDLRMNPDKGRSAAELLRATSAPDLEDLLRENSDEPHAASIARTLVEQRARTPIHTTRDLLRAIETALQSLPKNAREREVDLATRRVFQALRIAVNDEFGALSNLLRVLPECLKPGGRAVILTFHSGEDRRVKKAFQEGIKAGIYSSVSGEPLRPSPEEIRSNPRSSSTKLRWAIRK